MMRIRHRIQQAVCLLRCHSWGPWWEDPARLLALDCTCLRCGQRLSEYMREQQRGN